MIIQTVYPVPEHPRIPMECYVAESYNNRGERQILPAILILPGGAYRFHTPNECEELALRFVGEGFSCFVLRYSVDKDADFPKPLIDSSRAMWYIRSHAEAWSIHPHQLAVMGFSAGAHLASALCTMWHYPELQTNDMPVGGNRPDASVFGYLPTTFEDMVGRMPAGHKLHVLADEGRFADVRSLTTHALIDDRTPPAFMWKNIKQVPESSFRYAEGLKAAGVPYEVHVFTDKVPVNGVPDRYDCARNTKLWIPMAVNWLHFIYGIEDNEPFFGGYDPNKAKKN